MTGSMCPKTWLDTATSCSSNVILRRAYNPFSDFDEAGLDTCQRQVHEDLWKTCATSHHEGAPARATGGAGDMCIPARTHTGFAAERAKPP